MKLLRIGALLLPLALAACGMMTSPTPSLIPVPSGPVPTASPGAPTLVVRLDRDNGDRGAVQHIADVLSDGTVLRLNGQNLETNTLTTSGLSALQALLAQDMDLLATPASIKPVLAPGKTTSGRATIFYTFVLMASDGTRYTVSVPSTQSADVSAWVPDPAIDRLNTLANDLLDPTNLTGVGGLTSQAWKTYQPTQVAVFIRFTDGAHAVAPTPTVVSSGLPNIGPLDGLPVLPDVSGGNWPFADAPDTFGGAVTPSASERSILGPGTTYRCAFLPGTDALAAAARLPKAIGADSTRASWLPERPGIAVVSVGMPRAQRRSSLW